MSEPWFTEAKVTSTIGWLHSEANECYFWSSLALLFQPRRLERKLSCVVCMSVEFLVQTTVPIPCLYIPIPSFYHTVSVLPHLECNRSLFLLPLFPVMLDRFPSYKFVCLRSFHSFSLVLVLSFLFGNWHDFFSPFSPRLGSAPSLAIAFGFRWECSRHRGQPRSREQNQWRKWFLWRWLRLEAATTCPWEIRYFLCPLTKIWESSMFQFSFLLKMYRIWCYTESCLRFLSLGHVCTMSVYWPCPHMWIDEYASLAMTRSFLILRLEEVLLLCLIFLCGL